MKAITEAALRHARAGRPVFPCWPDKSPRLPNGFYGASRDPRTITHWFENIPDALLAIPTGKVSGVIVLDVDGEVGWASLRDLEREHGSLSKTASVKTPSGGAHFHFKYPGVEIRCSAGQLAPGIDVRAQLGYVIVPPSKLPDGRAYVVDDELPMAEMPDWLRHVLVRTTPAGGNGKRTPSSDWVALVREGVVEGRRNNQLARLAGHLLRQDIDEQLVAELVQLVNAGRFKPPLDRQEVDRVVNSIAAAERRRRALVVCATRFGRAPQIGARSKHAAQGQMTAPADTHHRPKTDQMVVIPFRAERDIASELRADAERSGETLADVLRTAAWRELNWRAYDRAEK